LRALHRPRELRDSDATLRPSCANLAGDDGESRDVPIAESSHHEWFTMKGSADSSATIDSLALVLGRVNFRESDLILQLFTEKLGRISALARGARSSKKRFSGSLEPIHTLFIELTEKPRGDLHTLREAHIATPRIHLVGDLERLETAGKALSWVKKAAPHHTAEPALFRAIIFLLDELNHPQAQHSPRDLLAGFGVRLLEVLGWGLYLTSCVSCGKPCPDGRAAWLHPERGGIICRECGGGPIRLHGAAREEMRIASQKDGAPVHSEHSANVLLVVDRALAAHMGVGEGSAGDLGSRLK
jgi:DNA repair protein RecO (recombination protein O)